MKKKILISIFLIFHLLITIPIYSITCSSCSYKSGENTKYCLQCGSSLDSKIQCVKCKYENISSDEYCLNCAAKLDPSNILIKEEPKTSTINTQESNKSQTSFTEDSNKEEIYLPTKTFPTLPPLEFSEGEQKNKIIKSKNNLYIDNNSAYLLNLKINKKTYNLKPYEILSLNLKNGNYKAHISKDSFNKTYPITIQNGFITIINPDKKGIYELDKEVYTTNLFPIYGAPGYNGPKPGVYETIKDIDFIHQKIDFGLDTNFPKNIMIYKNYETRIKIKKAPGIIDNAEYAASMLLYNTSFYEKDSLEKALQFLINANDSRQNAACLNIFSRPELLSKNLNKKVETLILKRWNSNSIDFLLKAIEKLNTKESYYQSYTITNILLKKLGVTKTNEIYKKCTNKQLQNFARGISFKPGGVRKPDKKNAKNFIPLLITCLQSNNEQTRLFACQGLSRLSEFLTKIERDYTSTAIDTLSDERTKENLSKQLYQGSLKSGEVDTILDNLDNKSIVYKARSGLKDKELSNQDISKILEKWNTLSIDSKINFCKIFLTNLNPKLLSVAIWGYQNTDSHSKSKILLWFPKVVKEGYNQPAFKLFETWSQEKHESIKDINFSIKQTFGYVFLNNSKPDAVKMAKLLCNFSKTLPSEEQFVFPLYIKNTISYKEGQKYKKDIYRILGDYAKFQFSNRDINIRSKALELINEVIKFNESKYLLGSLKSASKREQDKSLKRRMESYVKSLEWDLNKK